MIFLPVLRGDALALTGVHAALGCVAVIISVWYKCLLIVFINYVRRTFLGADTGVFLIAAGIDG